MKIKVLISSLALFYILFIIAMWEFQLIIPGKAIIFGALYEITAIPVLLLVPVLTVLFGVMWIMEGAKKNHSTHF